MIKPITPIKKSLKNKILRDTKEFFLELWGEVDNRTIDRALSAYLDNKENYIYLESQIRNLYDVNINSDFFDTINTIGKEQYKKINKISKLSFSFNPKDKRVSSFLNKEVGALVKDLTKHLKKNITLAIKESAKNNFNRKIAIDMLKNSIPLTNRDAKAVINYATKKGEAVLEELKDSGLSKLQLDKKYKEAYNKARLQKQKFLKEVRAKRIANTEVPRLKHFTELEALKQGQDNKQLGKSFKKWIRTNYKDNHENSITNDDLTIPINETFPDGSDYPSEINEFCELEYLTEVLN